MTWKILITDDDPIIRRIIRATLEGNGHITIEAKNGEEALSILSNHHPDLILMDIMMPKMDGLTACKLIKQNHQTNEIPIIIISANASTKDKELGYAAGAEVYLQKPVIPSMLIETINQSLQTKSPTPAL